MKITQSNRFFAIGIYHVKYDVNIGTLLRSAQVFGAAFVFTVGRRYRKQSSDVWSTWKNIPLFHYETVEDLKNHLPYGCLLVGIELNHKACLLPEYNHMPRACYLLGAEDHGLSEEQLKICHSVVQIPGLLGCLNVATAGSIVMYDRFSKELKESKCT